MRKNYGILKVKKNMFFNNLKNKNKNKKNIFPKFKK